MITVYVSADTSSDANTSSLFIVILMTRNPPDEIKNSYDKNLNSRATCGWLILRSPVDVVIRMSISPKPKERRTKKKWPEY